MCFLAVLTLCCVPLGAQETVSQGGASVSSAPQPWDVRELWSTRDPTDSSAPSVDSIYPLACLRLDDSTPSLPFPPSLRVSRNHTPKTWSLAAGGSAGRRHLKDVVVLAHCVGPATLSSVIVALGEAEAIRRGVHLGHPHCAPSSSPGACVVALESLGTARGVDVDLGAVIPTTPTLLQARQCCRLFNGTLFFTPGEVRK
jgi:hypothetical protein